MKDDIKALIKLRLGFDDDPVVFTIEGQERSLLSLLLFAQIVIPDFHNLLESSIEDYHDPERNKKAREFLTKSMSPYPVKKKEQKN